jgi:hypothetical protein
VASLENLLVGGLEEAVGHLVAVAVRLGQVHEVDLTLDVAVALLGIETGDRLKEKEILNWVTQKNYTNHTK